jgi:hypothetical protein
MILESVVTTRNPDGSINLSPMGPTFSDDATGNLDWSRFELRPFNTSTTYANLKENRCGILHVTDDVELIARAAIGKLTLRPRLIPGQVVDCQAIADACRWYEFRVERIDETRPRVNLDCKTVHHHWQREFCGFNRAKHAVLEAAILATRLDFLPTEEIAEQFQRLEIMVQKTGGQQEHKAFALLKNYAQAQ